MKVDFSAFYTFILYKWHKNATKASHLIKFVAASPLQPPPQASEWTRPTQSCTSARAAQSTLPPLRPSLPPLARITPADTPGRLRLLLFHTRTHTLSRSASVCQRSGAGRRRSGSRSANRFPCRQEGSSDVQNLQRSSGTVLLTTWSSSTLLLLSPPTSVSTEGQTSGSSWTSSWTF